MSSRFFRELLVIPLLALVLGTAANLVSGHRLPWWGKPMLPPPQHGLDFLWIDAYSADTLRMALPQVIFLDGRSANEFREAHVPGALRLNLPELDRQLTPELLALLGEADAVILYGDSKDGDLEQLLAQRLRLQGLAPPSIMTGGFPSWAHSSLEIATADEVEP